MTINKLSKVCKIPRVVNGKLVKPIYTNVDKFENVLGKELVLRRKK